MKFTGKLIGEFGGVNMYEIEIDQENGTIFVYEISENDLAWLNENNKSKWEVKYATARQNGWLSANDINAYCEGCFVTGEKDKGFINPESQLLKFAEAYFAGIQEYFGLSATVPTTPNAPVNPATPPAITGNCTGYKSVRIR